MHHTLVAIITFSLIFSNSCAQWVPQGPPLQCTGSFGPFYQGEATAFSPDGSTVATSYRSQFINGLATGVFIFRKTGGQWVQQILLPESSKVVNMALSSNGNTLVVHFDNDTINIYQYGNNTWSLQSTFLPPIVHFQFSSSHRQVAISYSGNVMVVGPEVYVRYGASWQLQSNLRPYDRPVTYQSFCDSANQFGCNYSSSSISADGKTVVIGDEYDPDNNTNAWVFINDGTGWRQQGPRLEGTNNSNAALQNYAAQVVGSGDGKTIAMSAGNNLCIFSLVNNVWIKQTNGYLVNNSRGQGCSCLSINYSGTTIVTGLYSPTGFYAWNLSGGTWSSNFSIQRPSTSNVDDTESLLTNQECLVLLDSSGTYAVLSDGNFRNNLGGIWAFAKNGNNFNQAGAEIFGTGMASGILSTVYFSPAISADGSTLAIGNCQDNGNMGAVWVFTHNGPVWTQIGSKISLPNTYWQPQLFGSSVALSADGNILAIGAPSRNSTSRGRVFMYKRNGQTYIPMGDSISFANRDLGNTVNLSNDGQTLFTGDDYQDGRVFVWSGSTWTLQGLCHVYDNVITSAVTALSGDGNTAVISDQSYDNSKGNINIYTRHGTTWAINDTDVRPASLVQNDAFPSSLAISKNGKTLATGLSVYNSNYNVFVYTGADSILNTNPTALYTMANDSGPYYAGEVAISTTGDTIVSLYSPTTYTNAKGLFNGYRFTGGHWTFMGSGVLASTMTIAPSMTSSADMHFVATVTLNSAAASEIDIFVLGTMIDSLVQNKPATCPQSANGKIVLQLRGGTPPYHYAWSNGGPDSAVAVNLLPGNYRLTISDAGSDTLVRQYTVTATYNPVVANNGFIWNCTANTGSISLNVAGGNKPYTYTWGTLPIQHTDTAIGLSAGNYAYTVTDSLGCVYHDTATLTALSYWANATSTDGVCGSGGTAIATMYGTAPYTYLWSNAQISDSINVPGGGTFTVTVTDVNGCTASASTTINSHCDNIIKGRVFFDKNNNCLQDLGELGTPNLTMIATNGTYTVYGNTDSLGNYIIETPTSGIFTVSIAHWQQCSYPVCAGGTYPVPVTLIGFPDTISNVNIPLVNPGIDLTMLAVVPQPYPGSSFNYTLYYGNLQDSVLPSGSVSIVYDSLLILNNTTPVYTTLDTVNHIITFNISNIGLLYPLAHSVKANFTVSANVLPHTIFPMQSFILPDSSDCNPLNNFITIPIYVAGSLDPNTKISYPENRLPPGDSLITYTIHFQNVGNTSTHFIQVVDTLQQGIDPASVVTLSTSSQPYIFSIKGQGIISWFFNPLALPDSASNPTGSQGYVTFQVKTVPGLALGTAISNTASIYFDNNNPVQTNTSSDTLVAGPCTLTFDAINLSICSGDTVHIGNYTHTQTGTYTDTLTNITGCDSIVTLNLTVTNRDTINIFSGLCSGDSVYFYGRYIDSVGIYDTLLSGGCDTLVILTLLTQDPPGPTYIYDTICANSPILFNGVHVDTAGFYYAHYSTGTSCDSSVILQLTVNPVPVVTLSWDSLIAEDNVSPSGTLAAWNGGSCGNDPVIFGLKGGSPLGGTYSGEYVQNNIIDFDSVLLYGYSQPDDRIIYTYNDTNGCSASAVDTIVIHFGCQGINTINPNSLFTLHPNPADDYVMINFDAAYTGSTIFIKDITGRQLLQTKLTTSPQQLPTGNLPPGVYMVTLYNNGQIGARLLVKE